MSTHHHANYPPGGMAASGGMGMVDMEGSGPVGGMYHAVGGAASTGRLGGGSGYGGAFVGGQSGFQGGTYAAPAGEEGARDMYAGQSGFGGGGGQSGFGGSGGSGSGGGALSSFFGCVRGSRSAVLSCVRKGGQGHPNCSAAPGPPVMSFVGNGGTYIQENTYKYIGQGAGQFEVVHDRVASSRRPLFVGGGCALVLLTVAFVVYLALPATQSSTMQSSFPPAELYNCGLQQAEWSIAQREYCCQSYHLGCPPTALSTTPTTPPPPTTTSEPFDCSAGLDHWRSGWSMAKMVFCCQREGQGCLANTTSARFDCDAGYSSWAAGWSVEKKSWCCAKAERGCQEKDPVTIAPVLGECILWGDPHVESFDSSRVDVQGEGEVWVVKSGKVGIQARYLATPYTNGLAATHDVAVFGPVLQNHVLKVGPLNGGKITWDGAPILEHFGALQPAGVGTLTYGDQGEIGDRAQSSLPRHILTVTFPGNFSMQVFRWENHLNVRIRMARAANMDGHCGNFNGVPEDDTHELILARLGREVAKQDLAFETYTPRTPGKRVSLDDCKAEQRQQAEKECRKAEGGNELSKDMFEGCVFDVCFAGKRYALQDTHW